MPEDKDERVTGGFGEARRIQDAGPGSGRATKHKREENTRRLESGEAWEGFCDTLRDARYAASGSALV